MGGGESESEGAWLFVVRKTSSISRKTTNSPRLVDRADEDHAVGEDGALEQAQRARAGRALALLHHAGHEDVVLEGVGVALRVGVELWEERVFFFFGRKKREKKKTGKKNG